MGVIQTVSLYVYVTFVTLVKIISGLSLPGVNRIFLLVASILFVFALPLTAQRIESIGKEKPLTVTGGITLSQIVYGVRGMKQRRAPYTWYGSGNVNFSLFGWNVPLSFGFSNQNTTFQQPFNQYSVNPTYKWITGHVGYTSMSFSPYTVSGHIFLGAGVELAPAGKWKLSALYGRFLKAVEPDTTNAQSSLPAFTRRGYGVKATYGDDTGFLDLIVFHAKDKINSISVVPDSLGVLPQENLVVSIGAGKRILKNVLIKAELAGSALSRDIRAEQSEQRQLLSKAAFLYTSRTSSSYYKAFKTSLDYQQDGFTLGVAYERIDPEYRTLGAYYFNNDLENITVNGAAGLWEGKLNVAVSAGTQHDNLDKTNVSTMRRMVGSLVINYTPSLRLNLSASYSTFQTFTNVRSQFVNINQLTPYDNLDTLNFTQLAKNATLTTLYALKGNDKNKQHVNLTINYQQAIDTQGDAVQNTGTRFYNINLGYAQHLVPTSMVIAASFNATIHDGAGFSTRTIGPTASLTRAFLNKKLRTMVSGSYNTTYSNGVTGSKIINGRVNASLSIKRKHAISLSTVVVTRKSQVEGSSRSFTEFTGTVGYNYTFGMP